MSATRPESPSAHQPLDARADGLVDAFRIPLVAGDPRRHHFIPQFFLRRFADAEDRLAVVSVARAARPAVTHVRNVAVVKDLYTVFDPEVGDTACVEKIIGLADHEARSAIERLAWGVLFPPSPADRLSIALWVGLLAVRDPHTRRIWEAIADGVTKLQVSLLDDEEKVRSYIRSAHQREPDGEEVVKVLDMARDLASWETTPDHSQMVMTVLDAALVTAPHLMQRSWNVAQFSEPGLVLSDRPVVLVPREADLNRRVGVGLGTAKELWLPLDRRTALIMHDNALVGERVSGAPPDFTVEQFNQALLDQARSEVYCHPDDLDRVASLEMPDPDRPVLAMDCGWIEVPADGVNRSPGRKRPRRFRRTTPVQPDV